MPSTSSLTGALRDGIGDTPMRAVTVAYRGAVHRLLLKAEWGNLTGSVKDRTAAGLLIALHRRAPLVPGTVVVESTSGNAGLALAGLLARIDCRFVAVVDPLLPEPTRRRLEAAGAELHCVHEPDGRGGYLLSRLAALNRLRRQHPGYRWTNQYRNPGNPGIHRATTGPEIAAQAGPGLDAVYIAVSTGGTLAGVAACLRSLRPSARVIAVDAEGSLVTGTRPDRRLITGLGASRPSPFLGAGSYDRAIRVADSEAIAVCRLLRADTGLCLGGSTGSVLRACLSELAGTRPPRVPVCLCADDGEKYAATIYDDRWLDARGIRAAVAGAMAAFRADGLVFEATWDEASGRTEGLARGVERGVEP